MKLHVENFAKIKEADIEIKGITVIAGENNTGKSTIGKILYCLYYVFKDIKLKINTERRRSIARALYQTSYFRNKAFPFLEDENDDETTKIIEIINDLTSIDINTLENYLKKSTIEFSEDTKNLLYDALNFENKELASLIVKQFFSYEFNNQFLPLVDTTDETILNLNIQKSNNSIIFKNKKDIVVNNELNLIKDCIYIDDPFSIDQMNIKYIEDSSEFLNLLYGRFNRLKHKDFLINRLSKSLKIEEYDLISNAILDEKLDKFKSMIKNVIQGDFLEKENRFVFLDSINNKELELENLSTGVKSLALLLKLLENRDITNKSMIVLDEPEIHLHPKWQLKFAEILILLQKEFELNIVINSHSPYFISAIQAYSKKYDSISDCKYYLANLSSENIAFFEDVTDNPGKIFDILSEPFDELDKIVYGEE